MAPHSPVATLDAAVALAKSRRGCTVSVGGGSTHDTTKGVATLLAEGGTIHDWEAHFEPPNKVTIPDFSPHRLPIITITTTMGAAELSRGAGFADRDLGRKILVADPNTIPGYIIIDGKALATTPVSILTSTAMGQLRIAIESIYSTSRNPISDGMAPTPSGSRRATPQLHELELTACCSSRRRPAWRRWETPAGWG